MSEREIFHDSHVDRDGESDGEEVVFREDAPRVENSTPTHNMVSANDIDVVIEGWERKFQHLSESIRDIQLASEKVNSNMNNIVRDGCAREEAQERRIQEMHEGLAQFLERCDPAHLTAPRRFETPVVSTPFTPSGAPARLRPDFGFDSPVNQSAPTESTRNNGDPRNIDPRNIDPRNIDPRNIDPRNRDHHDARDRSRDHRSNERPTHEDDRGDSGDRGERSEISEITDSVIVNAIRPKEQRAEHYSSVRRSARTDKDFDIEFRCDRSRDTFRRDRRATRSTFRGCAGSIRRRITDHTGTPVEFHTRND